MRAARWSVALALIVVAGACVDRGTQKQPDPHEGKRARTDEGLESLLAVPLEIQCRKAVIAVSPDYRSELALFGDGLTHAASGGVRGTGDVRVVFRTLTLDCKQLDLVVHADATERFQLMAAHDVKVKRVETTFTADLLRIEDGQMTYQGNPHVNIRWARPLRRNQD